jgi:hypothetical protein
MPRQRRYTHVVMSGCKRAFSSAAAAASSSLSSASQKAACTSEASFSACCRAAAASPCARRSASSAVRFACKPHSNAQLFAFAQQTHCLSTSRAPGFLTVHASLLAHNIGVEGAWSRASEFQAFSAVETRLPLTTAPATPMF